MSLLQTLRDALRRPTQTPALTATQTAVEPGAPGERAMIGWLHRELAEHPSKGLTPARLYTLLEAAEAGDLSQQHALFADMEEKDPQIASDLGKRKQAAAELEWQIVPPDGASRLEKQAAAQASAVFAGLDVADLILDLGDGLGHGWVMLELPWISDGNQRVIEQPRWVDHTWFQLHPDDRQDIRLRDGSITGEALWPLGWLRHQHKTKSGYPSRLGLHRTLVWPYLFQNYALGDLAELLDILGIPARLGTYPHGAREDEKATLLRAVTSLGHKAAGIIPEGMRIEYLEAAKADGHGYEIMLNWCERAKSKAILGGTLTTGSDQGSGAYALGQVHERGLASLIASDARQYAATLNRDLLWPLAALNFGLTERGRAPRFQLDLGETADYAALKDALPVFVSLGAKIPQWWLHEKTGIPQAAEGEEILATTAPMTPVVDKKTPEMGKTVATTATLTARLAAAPDIPDTPDQQTAQLATQADPLVAAMLGIIRRELDAAPNLDALHARLLTLYPELANTDLTDLLGQAFLAAELAGHLEADA